MKIKYNLWQSENKQAANKCTQIIVRFANQIFMAIARQNVRRQTASPHIGAAAAQPANTACYRPDSLEKNVK